jgi:2-octaprenyl-6-methoxyphenol hydroxylase
MAIMSASTSPRIFDVVVAGAGPAGLAFAAAVKQALGPGIAIALVDPRPQARDGRLRTVALAEGPRRLIEQVGVWTALAPLAQPIRRMAIYDGRVRDAVRVEQLRFGGADDEPLAHMAFNDNVADALGGAAAALGIEMMTCAVTAFAPGRDMAELELADGRRLKARLVVAADGARSRLRALAEVPTVGWDTGQTGMVATIAHERDHDGLAEQHFLPGGPFAILPMRGRFSSIVWNERHADAKAIAGLAPDDFVRELEYRFTLKLGALSLASRVEAVPFSLCR